MLYKVHMQQFTIDHIKHKAIPILKSAGITKSAIFGSYFRGDAKETSDIDFLIAFPEDTTLLDVVRLQRALEEQLQKKVDLVSYNAISPLLKDSILKYQYQLL
jgi:uncharacterized protein